MKNLTQKRLMTQIENVTQNTIRVLEGGPPNGVNHERKQAVTREYRSRYQKTAKKEKRTLLDKCTCIFGIMSGGKGGQAA
jgi:hypothetical protein